MNYRYQIQVVDDPKWYDNAVVFPTQAEADNAGASKFCAWTMAAAYRVVETTERANYRWVPGQGLVAIIQQELEAYVLPDGTVVNVDATASKGADTITYTLQGGEIVLAVKQPRID